MSLRRTPDSRPLEPTADDPEFEDLSATVKLMLRPPFMQVAGAEGASTGGEADGGTARTPSSAEARVDGGVAATSQLPTADAPSAAASVEGPAAGAAPAAPASPAAPVASGAEGGPAPEDKGAETTHVAEADAGSAGAAATS